MNNINNKANQQIGKHKQQRPVSQIIQSLTLIIPNMSTQLQIKIQMTIILSLQNKVKEISLHLLKPLRQVISSIINHKIMQQKKPNCLSQQIGLKS